MDAYLKDAEDLVGFPFNYSRMTSEQKNIFLKKYIDNITLLNGQITNIKYVDEVEKLIALCNNCYRKDDEAVL